MLELMLLTSEMVRLEIHWCSGLVSMTNMRGMLYGGVCSSSRVCAGVCEGVSIVSCNETCRIDIRSMDD